MNFLFLSNIHQFTCCTIRKVCVEDLTSFTGCNIVFIIQAGRSVIKSTNSGYIFITVDFKKYKQPPKLSPRFATMQITCGCSRCPLPYFWSLSCGATNSLSFRLLNIMSQLAAKGYNNASSFLYFKFGAQYLRTIGVHLYLQPYKV